MSDIPKDLQSSPPEVKTSFEVFKVVENVKSIQEAIKNMELEGKSDPFDFELSIMESHAEFYQSNPFLVKKLCRREDISFLFKMLANLAMVESGDKSLASVEMNLGNELANEYLYPHLNKDKKDK
jgi:hypothetical protein